MIDSATRRGEQTSPSSLGAWIRERRAFQRMSQKELAALSRISSSYLSDIERGRASQPSLQVLQAIARSLGEDPAELMMQAGFDIDRRDDLEPGSPRERRVLTMFRGLSAESQVTVERFTRFLHGEEHRYIQSELSPFSPRLPTSVSRRSRPRDTD